MSHNEKLKQAGQELWQSLENQTPEAYRDFYLVDTAKEVCKILADVLAEGVKENYLSHLRSQRAKL